MNNKRPILSICIPTYNRSNYLKQTLDSYVNNKAFDEEVEIVISDNASEDDTREMVSHYMELYPNIRYFRNDVNLVDKNMSLAMDRGSGHYLKLMNDNLLITEEGLQYLKDSIKEEISNKTPILFTNGIIFNKKKPDCVRCNKFDDLVENISYVVTAIMILGSWKEDWDRVKDKQKYAELRLCQDDWIYQIMANKERMLLYTGSYCKYLVLDKKCRTGYNWFEVHVTNYYKILQPYIDRGLVSEKALHRDRVVYLKNLNTQIVMKYLYNIIPEWQFDMSGATAILWRHFYKEPLFYAMMLTLPLWGGYKVLRFFFYEKNRK